MATAQLDRVIPYIRQVVPPGLAAALTDSQLLARFAADGDETAFTALMRRHGPMVLGVCRRVLHDGHAAEDACQAVFLVLARKAGALTRPGLLGQWLYGVAYRTALKARAEATRRRHHERQALGTHIDEPSDALAWQDLRPVIDEEVNHLPRKYRVPVVLCYLEGKTNAEAARLLGCPRGTIATLLARARDRLRQRFIHRGLAPTAGLALGSLLGSARALAVPAAFQTFTVQAARLFAAGETQAAAALSAQAASLAKGVLKAMLMTKLKIVTVVFLGAGLLGTGATLATYRAGAGEPGSTQVEPAALPPAPAGAGDGPPPAAADAVAEASYRTTNFAVQAPTPEIARQVGRAAERHRQALARLWLGQELPAWNKLCPLQVTVTITDQGPASATSFTFDQGKVLGQTMRLQGSLEQVLTDLLPHEITHAVLAHWSGRPLPRWADEGAATLSESVSSRLRQETALGDVLDGGHRIPLPQLLSLQEYPKDIRAFYAQGYSLTDFLVGGNGRGTFLAFITQGERDGWEKAVGAHYNYPTVAALEAAWLIHARKSRLPEAPALATVSAHIEPRRKAPGRLPAGPAPTQCLAACAKGQLTVWREVTVFEPRTGFDGQGRPVTAYAQVSTMQEAHYRLDDVQVQDTTGKAIDAKELPRLLPRETPSLVVFGTGPVDPLHLRLIKEGTLVFVLPPMAPTPWLPPAAVPVPVVPLVPPAADSHQKAPLDRP